MTRSRRSGRGGDEGGYDVGYGKPPKATRFKPGHSGNPKGRPKGVRNFKTDVKATLEASVKVRQDGKVRRLSTQAAMLERLRQKALGGELRALDRLLGLAQSYNNEELAAATRLPAEDAALLDLFKARVLSGAAGRAYPALGSPGGNDGAAASRSIEPEAQRKRKPRRQRRAKAKARRCSEATAEAESGTAGEGDA